MESSKINLYGKGFSEAFLVKTDRIKPIPTALMILSYCIAGLIAGGVIAISTKWLATTCVATAATIGTISLFFAVFNMQLPKKRSHSISYNVRDLEASLSSTATFSDRSNHNNEQGSNSVHSSSSSAHEQSVVVQDHQGNDDTKSNPPPPPMSSKHQDGFVMQGTAWNPLLVDQYGDSISPPSPLVVIASTSDILLQQQEQEDTSTNAAVASRERSASNHSTTSSNASGSTAVSASSSTQSDSGSSSSSSSAPAPKQPRVLESWKNHHTGMVGPKPTFGSCKKAKVPTLSSQIGPQNIEEFYSKDNVYSASLNNPREESAHAFTLEEFLTGKIEHISVDEYAPWIFPYTKAPSGKERTVPVLDEETIQAFKENPQLRAQVLRSFRYIVQFYGCEIKPDGTIVEGAKFLDRLSALIDLYGISKLDTKLAKRDAHFRCMAQIIKSLAVLGFEKESKAFFEALQSVYNNWKDTVVPVVNIKPVPVDAYEAWKVAYKEAFPPS